MSEEKRARDASWIDPADSRDGLTVDKALGNAARLLYHAEQETNLQLVDRLDALAENWINLAAFMHHREHDL